VDVTCDLDALALGVESGDSGPSLPHRGDARRRARASPTRDLKRRLRWLRRGDVLFEVSLPERARRPASLERPRSHGSSRGWVPGRGQASFFACGPFAGALEIGPQTACMSRSPAGWRYPPPSLP
jgi:hypothetical protein